MWDIRKEVIMDETMERASENLMYQVVSILDGIKMIYLVGLYIFYFCFN